MPLRLAQLITGKQVKSIKLINGTPPKNRLVVVTQTRDTDNREGS